MLKVIDDLPVYPGICVNIAERNKSLLYYIDTKGAIIDGQIVKCIRSTDCFYKLPFHSKTRYSKCQDVSWSCLR